MCTRVHFGISTRGLVQLSDGETVYDIERVIAGIDGTGTADQNVQTATGLCAVLADIESGSLTFECMSDGRYAVQV